MPRTAQILRPGFSGVGRLWHWSEKAVLPTNTSKTQVSWSWCSTPRRKKALCKLKASRQTVTKRSFGDNTWRRRGTNNLLTMGTGQYSGRGAGGGAPERLQPSPWCPRRSERPFPGSRSKVWPAGPRPDPPPDPSQPGDRAPSAVDPDGVARCAASRSEGPWPSPDPTQWQPARSQPRGRSPTRSPRPPLPPSRGVCSRPAPPPPLPAFAPPPRSRNCSLPGPSPRPLRPPVWRHFRQRRAARWESASRERAGSVLRARSAPRGWQQIRRAAAVLSPSAPAASRRAVLHPCPVPTRIPAEAPGSGATGAPLSCPRQAQRERSQRWGRPEGRLAPWGHGGATAGLGPAAAWGRRPGP